jgi:WD40 repeat protein
MKLIHLLTILGLILVSCAKKPQESSPQKYNTRIVPLETATSVNMVSTPTTFATKQADSTPTSAGPASISLLPIDLRNADRIQLLFGYQVEWDTYSYGLAAVSPDRRLVALAPKYDTHLTLLPLTWKTDHSIVPAIKDSTSRTYYFRTEALAFSPNSAYLAAADGIDTVKVYDLLRPNNIKAITGLDSPDAVTFTSDSEKLIIGTRRGLKGYLQLWDLETVTFEWEISRDTLGGGVCSLAISPDNKILAAGFCTYVFDISTWDTEKEYTYITRLAGLDEVGYCPHFCTDDRNIIAFNPVTGDIASGTNYDRIPIQDPRTGKLKMIISTVRRFDGFGFDAGPVNSLSFTKDGEILVIAAAHELQLRAAKEGRLLWNYGYIETHANIDAATITADSKLLISVNSDGQVGFWGIPER